MKTQPVKIRLPVTWLEAIRTKCEEEGIPQPERGKTGGPAEWIRRLIARELGEEMFDPHLLQKGKKNFAHSHNLRVWLVDKNGDFVASRSPKTRHVDRSKRGKSITHFAGSRSLVSDDVDQ